MSEKKTKKSWFYTGEEDVPWEQWSVDIVTIKTCSNSPPRVVNAELRQPKSMLGTGARFHRRYTTNLDHCVFFRSNI